MIHRKYSPVLLCHLARVCALWMLVVAGCDRTAATSPSTSTKTVPADGSAPAAAPSLPSASHAPQLPEDAPVLLSDEDSRTEDPAGPVADNSRCFVCHANYMDEQLAVTHARAKIGCADCHGPSDAHIADESWASGGKGTPPSLMYPREKINSTCLTCHPQQKIDTPQHQAVLATPAGKVCTDCHGRHRLPHRRCQWK